MRVLAIIPARSGSKGVPGKNWRVFDGKPLISYTIESALKSELISEIVVSSNADEVINLVSDLSEIKLHKRSDLLSTDESPIAETILDILSQQEVMPEYLCLLQPTSPLRTSKQIDKAINLLQKSTFHNSLISMVRMDDIHPARMYRFDEEKNTVKPIIDFQKENRRQELSPVFFRNGAIYITRLSAFLKSHSFMADPILPYEMPYLSWLNIDHMRDAIIAEALIRNWKKDQELS